MNDITINSISLALNEEWELRENYESNKAWNNNSGDKLSLNFFALKPDLPEEITSIHSLRGFYRGMITQADGAIVEVEKEYFDSLLAIKTIFKFHQKVTGFSFLASYTIPRENFSIVLKVQCHEHGVTGMREAVVFSLEGVLDDLEIKKGWFADPYKPEFQAPLLANISDRALYDEHFPKHPLSRARKTLKMLKEKVEFSDEIVASPKFFLDFE